MILPESVYDLPTLAAVLEARGETPADLYQCSGCPRCLSAAHFVATAGLPGASAAYLCHTCASGPFREEQAAQAAAARAQLDAWATDAAAVVRVERDRRVNACLWTSDPSAPLTEDCRAAWADYRAQLHRLTLDFPGPAAVVWPMEPAMEYCSNPV